AEDGIRDFHVTGVQTCALPIYNVFQGGAMREQVEVLEHETHVLAQPSHQALLLVQRTAAIDLDVTDLDPAAGGFLQEIQATQEEIGRASCRERVKSSLVAGSSK